MAATASAAAPLPRRRLSRSAPGWWRHRCHLCHCVACHSRFSAHCLRHRHGRLYRQRRSAAGRCGRACPPPRCCGGGHNGSYSVRAPPAAVPAVAGRIDRTSWGGRRSKAAAVARWRRILWGGGRAHRRRPPRWPVRPAPTARRCPPSRTPRRLHRCRCRDHLQPYRRNRRRIGRGCRGGLCRGHGGRDANMAVGAGLGTVTLAVDHARGSALPRGLWNDHQ